MAANKNRAVFMMELFQYYAGRWSVIRYTEGTWPLYRSSMPPIESRNLACAVPNIRLTAQGTPLPAKHCRGDDVSRSLHAGASRQALRNYEVVAEILTRLGRSKASNNLAQTICGGVTCTRGISVTITPRIPQVRKREVL